LGTFAGGCEPVDEVEVASSGNPVNVRSYISVQQASGNVAGLSVRFDFFLDASCATNPIASLSFESESNQVTFEGTQPASGREAQRVRISLAAPSGGTPAGGGRMLFGNAIPLSAPSELFSGLSLLDLWLVQGDILYEGDLTTGPEGFPTGLDLGATSHRVSSLPPLVAACRATAVTWGGEGCSGNVQAAASGTATLLADITGPSTGSATFTCTAGTWAPSATICSAVVAPPAPPAGCAAAPVTWTVNGLTCQAEIEGVAEGASRLVLNTNPATRGLAQFTCTGGAQLVTSASCDPPLPPPPTLTDPAQIAQAKNCIACHSVSDPAQSVGGVSFQVIADHYRGSPPAAGVLESRVKSGSIGTFGALPMPSNPQISDAELAIVIPWILNR
jgi:cytochrome c